MTTSASTNDEDDPYLWLEEVTGVRALAWAEAETDVTLAELGSGESFESLRTRILSILDSRDRVPEVTKSGEFYYNFWRDDKRPRGVWRRTTLDEYKKDAPVWETVLDVDALAVEEEENWVYAGASILTPSYDRALVSLSRGGADAAVVREFDLVDKAFVSNGFVVPEAKSNVAWAGRDRLFVATDFGPGSLTASGYPRLVRSWQRGTNLADAPEDYAGETGDVGVSAFADLAPGFENEFLVRSIDFFNRERYIKLEGEWVRMDVPADSQTTVHRGLLLVNLKSDWRVAQATYAAGSLLVTRLGAFLAGERDFEILFTPTERKALAGIAMTLNHVIVTEREDVSNKVYVATETESGWRRTLLMGGDRLATIGVSAVDGNASDDYTATVTDFVTPTTVSMHTVGEDGTHYVKHEPAHFDSNDVSAEQRWATSKDGTRVPYFVVGPSGPGPRPTLLTGYGGFEIPLMPSYEPTVGAGWLELGHVFVVANIRGGGEFGPLWHQAALKDRRMRAYEDFIAVAEDLIRAQVTTPGQLGISGGSNGGLLVGNMLTMRPDLFGAIACAVPLLDMRRYHRLLAGASWMAEYGDPDDPDEWTFIRGFSPYHNVEKDVKYPPVLMTTSTRDDRVHPGHARKMTAKMQAQGHRVLYYENTEGGHGGAADNNQAAFMLALRYRFLRSELER
jgi:prolyl oligopeptidase